MSDLSDQLNELLAKIHPGATMAHDTLHSIDLALQAEDDGIRRHAADILNRSQLRRVAIYQDLTDIARLIGVAPAPRVQQIPQQAAAPLKHPRSIGGVC